MGLSGSRRLMDALDIDTGPAGTTITMRKAFPPGAPLLTAPQLQSTVDRIAAGPSADPLAELQLQNQELVRALDEVRARQEDLARANQELAETNTGVLAFYDELETLHRVGVLLSSKLDLETLLQSIIDATTELTNAPFGAFFQLVDSSGAWLLQATAGPARGVLADLPNSRDSDFFGAEFVVEPGSHPADRYPHPFSCGESKFARALDTTGFHLESCLTIPVCIEGKTLGAMVFGSGEPAAFTERSERIVSSIAAQAASGIEKTRLFEDLRNSSAAKDRFLAMLSHELRTPLNPVLAVVSSLVGDTRLPEDARHELNVVLRNVRLEARLIDDLLDFSRISNGKLELQREPLDLHALIRSVVDICAEDIATGRHVLTLAFTAPRATVLGDSARLQQVLWNVLKNAVKFTPVPGRIAIRTAQGEGGAIEVSVSDNGVGIEAPALAQIFGAFEQGGSHMTAKFGGLGLGLAITKAFVELHEGTIRATSGGPGQGTQVTIRLPLLTLDTPGESLAVGAPPVADAPPLAGTLLVVDDHADTLDIMTRLLTRRGYQVLTARSCESAIETARQHRFDLIVSDLGLPDGSGLDLLAKLRRGHDVPAVALSGYGMEEDVRQTRAAGYNEHLTKPIDFPLLITTIGKLLNGQADNR